MNKIKTRILKLTKWQHFPLIIIVLVVIGLHITSAIHVDTLLFDERYYVTDARLILAGNGTDFPEHPPLAKLLIVESMRIFGDNPLGWRLFSIIFGTTSIVLLYFICRKLKMPQKAVLFTTLLFSFENLNFVQSGIAMFDVYCLTFMLLATLMFFHEKLLLAGLFTSLSILCKLPGAAVLGVFFLFWLLKERRRWQLFVVPFLIAVISFPVLMSLVEYPLFGEINNPLIRIQQMYFEATSLTFGGNIYALSSRPLEWLMNKGIIFYSFSPQNILAISPTISILILPAVLYLVYKTFNKNISALFGLIWFSCTYFPWLVINLVFDRLTYLFYFYPVISAICLSIGVLFFEIWGNCKYKKGAIPILVKTMIIIYFCLHIIFFVILSPLSASLISWVKC